MSGSNASDYTERQVVEYQDNDVGDPRVANQGFVVGPLDQVLYGAKKAAESKKMWRKRKLAAALSATEASEWK